MARDVALKTVSPRAITEDARVEAWRSLEREAEVRASVEHPALLPLYDRFAHAGAPHLIGPWLGGGAVLERWPDRPPLAATIQLAESIGGALDALHAAGWIHGDIAPGNLLFDDAGRARLTDFGSCVPHGSRRTRHDGELGHVRWGVTRLTAAPEMWSGAPVDGRADLYALTVILYRLLAGRWPYDAEDPAQLPALHRAGWAEPPSRWAPTLAPALDAVILRGLSVEPGARYPTGAALAEALRAAAREGRRASWLRSVAGPASQSPLERVRRARAALEAHLEQRPAPERAELERALVALRRQDARRRALAGAEARRLVAPVASLAAAEQVGLLHALAMGPRGEDGLAAELGLEPSRARRLLRFLAAEGHVARAEDGWTLREPWPSLYADAIDRPAERAPVGEQLERWSALGRWVRGGPPLSEMDADEAGRAYAAPARELGDNTGRQAAALAEALSTGALVPDRGSILDIGAGSAVWSLALAARWPEATVTALDRPAVLEVARARARDLGLEHRLLTAGGSWQDPAGPAGPFGLVVIAKVAHLCDEDALFALLQRAAGALAPEGRLLVLDTAPEDLDRASRDALRYDLALALRTTAGRIHALSTYDAAFRSAGLERLALIPVSVGGAGLVGLLAGRPGEAVGASAAG